MPMLEANPVVKAELECIDKAIRVERAHLQDIEFETDEIPNDSYLQYLKSEKGRGVRYIVTNF